MAEYIFLKVYIIEKTLKTDNIFIRPTSFPEKKP